MEERDLNQEIQLKKQLFIHIILKYCENQE